MSELRKTKRVRKHIRIEKRAASPNDLLTERQAIRYLDINPDQFRHEVNQGRIGKRHERWFRRGDLDAWKNLSQAQRRAMRDMDLTGVPRTLRALARQEASRE
jgi:hypothetical protein